MTRETLTLHSDCDALLVPSGRRLRLSRGTEVTVTQALGDSVTVQVGGNLARIAGAATAALGDKYRRNSAALNDAAPLKERVWQCLRSSYDPEIPVNIVELGLVYGCRISELVAGGTRVDVRMTLTAPACGMGPVLAAEIEDKLMQLKGVDSASVEIVFDPPWSRDMMSDAARLELGLL